MSGDLPMQRGDNEVGATVLSMVVSGLKEVKDAVSTLSRDMTEQMSRLPDLYVPRREIERKWDEHVIDFGELKASLATEEIARAKDTERLEKALKSAEDDRRSDRRWFVSITVAGVPVILAIYSFIEKLLG